MRLIDADALKAYIDAQKGRPFIGCTVGEALKIMTDEQPTVTPEPHWIPCEERLPDKKKKTYWVCLDGGGQCQCRWTNDMYGLGANEWSKWGWHVMDKPQYSVVVAWRELPESYKVVTE